MPIYCNSGCQEMWAAQCAASAHRPWLCVPSFDMLHNLRCTPGARITFLPSQCPRNEKEYRNTGPGRYKRRPHQACLWVELVRRGSACGQNWAPRHRHHTAEAPARPHRVLLLAPFEHIDLHIVPAPEHMEWAPIISLLCYPPSFTQC